MFLYNIKIIFEQRKKKREARKREPQDAAAMIPTSSFSDIAFLLIIFFIVTTTLIRTKGFNTEIPAGEESQEASEEQPTIIMSPTELKFNDKHITMEELREKLVKMKLGEKEDVNEKVIVVEAHGAVQFQPYFEVMALIKETGGVMAIVREDKSAKKGAG